MALKALRPKMATLSSTVAFAPKDERVERLRGRAGQAQRKRRLARTDGLCEMCEAEGVTTFATVVDHIKPLALGGTDEDGNTRNLCGPHHDQVTAEQFDHAQPIKARGIGRDGRPTSPDHPWNRS